MVLFWLISIIPALYMSFQGKAYGLVGAWSGPIMDFLIPGVYFWALGMSKTYITGRDYFIRRMILLLVGYMFLRILGALAIHNFFTTSMFFCLSFCYMSSRKCAMGMRLIIYVGIMMAIYLLVFGRGEELIAAEMEKHIGEDVAAADKYGSTFTAMTTLLGSIILYSACGRWISRSFMKGVPIIMVAVNICFVSFVIMTQSGNKAKDVEFKYETISERIRWKLFGDRANVWMMGWDEVKTPPYVFKDMRQAYMLVYQELKRLARKAGQIDCNVIFTAWTDLQEITLPDGTRTTRTQPKLPNKILDNFLGLTQIVAYVNTADKDGQKAWYYVLEGKPTMYAKDQLYCRRSCMPEDIFSGCK
jgi:hypothetical protein